MTDLLSFSLDAWKREPDMRIEDAYKWLFHATRGGEHAVSDEEVPRRWLDREWPTLTPPQNNELLLVPLRPDGRIVRLQLRPFRSAGGDKEKLLRAFVASARAFKGDTRGFVSVWNELGEELKRRNRGNLTFIDWKRLNQEVTSAKFPAIDHSEHYEKFMKPAYRVLTDVETKKLLNSA